MFRFPEKVDSSEVPKGWLDETPCSVVAVENLGLTYPFFTGECTLREGTGFTQAGYLGEKAEMLVPWWFAEEYDIQIGDTLTRQYCYPGTTEYTYYLGEVVGIYESSSRLPDYNDYPVYIPMSIAEIDYEVTMSGYRGTDEIRIQRADFILPSRESFEDFVLTAKENGLDFRCANLVFNNRTYDMLQAELSDIHRIALITALTILAVGLGMIIFFTVYLCNSRKEERILLSSLGMKKGKIGAMIALEIAIMLCLALGLGVFLGYGAAEAVCAYVEVTVSEKAELSQTIETAGKATTIDDGEPMSNASLHISVSDVSLKGPSTEIHYLTKLKEGEVGIMSRECYQIGDKPYNSRDPVPRYPVTIIGLTDREALGIKTNTLYEVNTEYFVAAYVSEDFDFSGFERNLLYILSEDEGTHKSIFPGALEIIESHDASGALLVIAGIYEPNEYFSGNDILMTMEEYHSVMAHFSITDEDFCFERMKVFEK